MAELKPCPFCGAPPHRTDAVHPPYGHLIECVNESCGAGIWDRAPGAAARAWNRRPQPVALECPECSAGFLRIRAPRSGARVVECLECSHEWEIEA